MEVVRGRRSQLQGDRVVHGGVGCDGEKSIREKNNCRQKSPRRRGRVVAVAVYEVQNVLAEQGSQG